MHPNALTYTAAPELDVDGWFNTSTPLTINQLRGTVIVLHAFQMLCPGCVFHGTPLAQRLHTTLRDEDVVVIGIHTVFEHHDAMKPEHLAVYLDEFGITMPVAVDRRTASHTPASMTAYAMNGTPTLVLIDRNGNIRHTYFGNASELHIGIALGRLLAETFEPDPPIRNSDAAR